MTLHGVKICLLNKMWNKKVFINKNILLTFKKNKTFAFMFFFRNKNTQTKMKIKKMYKIFCDKCVWGVRGEGAVSPQIQHLFI